MTAKCLRFAPAVPLRIQTRENSKRGEQPLARMIRPRRRKACEHKVDKAYREGFKGGRVFYCVLGNPGEKDGIERNHVEMRKILVKGVSFDNLT